MQNLDQNTRDALSIDMVVDITTTGRRSGDPRRIEIWCHLMDGQLYLAASPGPRSWYANLYANPGVTLHLKADVKADIPVRARPITRRGRATRRVYSSQRAVRLSPGTGSGCGDLGARKQARRTGSGGELNAMHSIDAARVQSALSNSVVGHSIHYHQVLASTMDTARDLAHDGEREGAVIVAEEQNKGRGRFNRVWVSPPGLNLYFTVLLRPEREQLPYMNMAAALAVFDTVAGFAGLKPAVKWPNDVRVGGRKLSGILIETEFDGDRLAHALVGIGLNVNLDVSEHPEIADTATSLRSAGRTRVRPLGRASLRPREFRCMVRPCEGGQIAH